MAVHNSAATRAGGFSLIESVIVLALVGLVIGAIWAISATTRQQYLVNRMASEIFATAQRINQRITINDYNTLAPANINTTAISMKLVPPNWIKSSSTLEDVWGNTLGVAFAPTGNYPRVDINMTNLPRTICRQLIGAISRHLSGANINDAATPFLVRIYSGGWITLPVTPLGSHCPASLNNVTFVVTLTRNG